MDTYFYFCFRTRLSNYTRLGFEFSVVIRNFYDFFTERKVLFLLSFFYIDLSYLKVVCFYSSWS